MHYKGQTFKNVVLVMGDNGKNKKSKRTEIFPYGQLYVALSRVKSMDGLYIDGKLEDVEKLAAPEVLKFYREIQNNTMTVIEKNEENLLR